MNSLINLDSRQLDTCHARLDKLVCGNASKVKASYLDRSFSDHQWSIVV